MVGGVENMGTAKLAEGDVVEARVEVLEVRAQVLR